MTRWSFLSAVLLFCPRFCFAQQPAKNNEATMAGLRGPVRSVLTENFNYQDNSQGKPAESALAIYDPEEFLLEEYRYEPDGSLRSHIKYTRKGWQVYRTETTSVVDSENRTFVQSFNSAGLVTGTETYDGSGSLISKTKNDFPSTSAGATVSTLQEANGEGAVSTTETIDESTDPSTGLSRQSASKDGKPYYDWLIQRDTSGKPVADALRFVDGSFNEREVKPDGTTLEHKYWAPTKTHTYQTTDANNRVIEVINDAPGDYTKTTYHYDGSGRRTEIANYDHSGKLLRKGITRYQDDGNGNWIEQREYNWDVTLGNKPPKLGLVNRRTITYY
jgi:YD repeat-containing protein